jgi:hypothetical protein
MSESFVNPRPIGPYGTNEGDMWLGTGSAVQAKLDEEGDGLVLIHEMINKGGKVQEALYVTDNADIIAEAKVGHEHYIAQHASQN